MAATGVQPIKSSAELTGVGSGSEAAASSPGFLDSVFASKLESGDEKIDSKKLGVLVSVFGSGADWGDWPDVEQGLLALDLLATELAAVGLDAVADLEIEDLSASAVFLPPTPKTPAKKSQ